MSNQQKENKSTTLNFYQGFHSDGQCVVPENIQTPSWRELEIPKEEGGQRPRKFQRGGGLYD